MSFSEWLMNGLVWIIVAAVAAAVILIVPWKYDAEIQAEEWEDFYPSSDDKETLQ